jgi:hypothetical protein
VNSSLIASSAPLSRRYAALGRGRVAPGGDPVNAIIGRGKRKPEMERDVPPKGGGGPSAPGRGRTAVGSRTTDSPSRPNRKEELQLRSANQTLASVWNSDQSCVRSRGRASRRTASVRPIRPPFITLVPGLAPVEPDRFRGTFGNSRVREERSAGNFIVSAAPCHGNDPARLGRCRCPFARSRSAFSCCFRGLNRPGRSHRLSRSFSSSPGCVD